jgi:ribosomal protein L21
MFAIVEAGGRQEKVAPGALVIVDHLDVEAGAEVTFDKVLLVETADGGFVAGTPYVKGASVTGVVEAQTRQENRGLQDQAPQGLSPDARPPHAADPRARPEHQRLAEGRRSVMATKKGTRQFTQRPRQ